MIRLRYAPVALLVSVACCIFVATACLASHAVPVAFGDAEAVASEAASAAVAPETESAAASASAASGSPESDPTAAASPSDAGAEQASAEAAGESEDAASPADSALVIEVPSDEGKNILYTITGADTVVIGGTTEEQPHTIDYAYTGALTIPDTVTYQGKTYSVTGVQARAFAAYYEYGVRVDCMVSSITLGAGVKTIGAYAFEYATNLESFTIETGSLLTSIGTGAFHGSALDGFVIPENVEELGGRAFADSSLSDIRIESQKLAVLEYGVFAGTRLSNLDFIKGTAIVSIQDGCFEGAALTTAIVPAQISSMGMAVFRNCRSLGYASFEEGSLITEIPASTYLGCTSLQSYTFPSFITSVEERAFAEAGLRYIEVPTWVLYLGEGAFADCEYLSSAVYADGHEAIYLNDELFSGCSSLSHVVIPESIRDFGASCFANCTALTAFTFPKSVEKLGDFSFTGCTALATIVFQTDARYVESSTSTFYKAPAIRNVVFYGKKSTSLVFQNALPNYYATVSYYASKADWEADAEPQSRYALLIGATPATATSDQIFEGAYLPKPERGGTWGYETGYSATAEMVDSFAAYRRGTDVVLKVGDTFTDTTVDGAEITYTVEELPDGTAPGRCKAGIDTLFGTKTAMDPATTGSITLPELACGSDGQDYRVDMINDGAFMGCSRFVTVTVPATVKTIGARAFARCTTLRNVYFSADASTIQDKSIFLGCANIKLVVFGGKKANVSFGISDPDIYYTVLYYASEHDRDIDNRWSTLVVHERAILDDLDPSLVRSGFVPTPKVGYEWAYEDGFGGTVPLDDSTVVYATGVGFQVPVEVVNGPVRSMDCWFKVLSYDEESSHGTVQVGLGKDGVTAIHTSLAGMPIIPASVTDSDGSTYDVVAVGDYAFGSESYWQACVYLTGISLPRSIEAIGMAAFKYCEKLATVTIPMNVSSLGASAYEGCTALTSAYFAGRTLTALPERAFYGDYLLESITLPEGLVSVGDGAFEACYKELNENGVTVKHGPKSVSLPSTLTTIGNRSFYGLRTLSGTLALPARLAGIGEGAFSGCIGFGSVRFLGDADALTVGDDAFSFGRDAACASVVYMGKKHPLEGDIVYVEDKNGAVDVPAYYNVRFYASQSAFAAGIQMGNVVILADTSLAFASDNKLEGAVPALEEGSTWRMEAGFAYDERAQDSFYCIRGYDLSLATVSFDQDEYYYSGASIRPVPYVTWTDGTVLERGVHYEFDTSVGALNDGYANNRHGPVASVYLLGIGDYAGSAVGTFAISLQVDSGSSFNVTFEGVSTYTYDGTEHRPSFTVSATLLGDPYDAVEGVDYVAGYANNVNAGMGEVVVRALSLEEGGSGIFGGTYVQTFTILPESIRTCTVAGSVVVSEAGVAFDGLTLTNSRGERLAEGTDYAVHAGQTRGTGTDAVGTVYFYGTGNYTGTIARGYGKSSGSGGGSGGGTGGGTGSASGGAGTSAGTATQAGSAQSGDSAVAADTWQNNAQTDAAAGGGGNEGVYRVYEIPGDDIEVTTDTWGKVLELASLAAVAAGLVLLGVALRKRRFDADLA